jgi:hypothetical protein
MCGQTAYVKITDIRLHWNVLLYMHYMCNKKLTTFNKCCIEFSLKKPNFTNSIVVEFRNLIFYLLNFMDQALPDPAKLYMALVDRL